MVYNSAKGWLYPGIQSLSPRRATDLAFEAANWEVEKRDAHRIIGVLTKAGRPHTLNQSSSKAPRQKEGSASEIAPAPWRSVSGGPGTRENSVNHSCHDVSCKASPVTKVDPTVSSCI